MAPEISTRHRTLATALACASIIACAGTSGYAPPSGEGGALPAPDGGAAWRVLPGSACAAEAAVDPATDAPRLEWGACPDGAACTVLSAGGARLSILGVRSSFGVSLVTYEHSDARYTTRVVAPVDGAPIFAVRSGSRACQLQPIAGASGLAAVGGWFATLSKGGFVDLEGLTIMVSSWTDPTRFASARFSRAELGVTAYGDVTPAALGARTLFLLTGEPPRHVPTPPYFVLGAHHLRALDLATLALSPASPDALLGSFADVERGLLAQSSYELWGFSDDLGSAEALRSTEPPVAIASFSVDRRNDTLVWLEGTPDGAAPDYPATHHRDAALYASPIAITTAELRPALVARLGTVGADAIVANDGVAALSAEPSVIVVRLSDGLGWRAPWPAGAEWARPLWIDAKDVWLATSIGVVRVARAPLGAAGPLAARAPLPLR